MVFCTHCGNKLSDEHRFCAKCGSAVNPPTESIQHETKEPSIINENLETTVHPQPADFNIEDTVDRKTLFDDGLLVLTSKDLILYTSDERDELKRISLQSIDSCSYSTIRHGLLIKRRINEENNFQQLLAQKHSKFASIKSKKEFYQDELHQTRARIERDELKTKIFKLDEELSTISQEIKELESDPTKISTAQKKIADIKKEIFRLPKEFLSQLTAREEYQIWEYAINRRMLGVAKIKIHTIPYNAVVTINRQIMGTTPITFDKPLIDEAILTGKYQVTVVKEGYQTSDFTVPTDLGHGSIFEEFELFKRDNPDPPTDQLIYDMRKQIKYRSIDLSFYDIEKEIEGKNEIILLTKDELLVLDKTKEQLLFEIPFGAITDAKYDKGFLRRNKAVKITYNEKYFKDIVLNFWIDDNNGKISSSELKQRSESLADILNQKRKESRVYDIPRRVRSPQYFIITENDIQNNFSRFEPFEFERLIARLFEKKGYKTSITQERGDFGVDVLAEAGSEKLAIQVKHWKAPVGGPDIHKTLGSMITFGANRAMVITSSDFTTQAYEIQKRGAPIELWNGSRLRDEFRQYLLEAIKEARNSEKST